MNQIEFQAVLLDQLKMIANELTDLDMRTAESISEHAKSMDSVAEALQAIA